MSEGEGISLVAEEEGEKGARLDALDCRILEALLRDSRNSFRRMASKLRVSPATLIARMRRLEREKIVLGYSAHVNFPKIGFEYMALIEATITKGALLEVQRKIAHMAGVAAVYDVTGESDSLVVARCRSRGELSRLVKKILALPNVQRTNTHIVLNVIKENYRLVHEV